MCGKLLLINTASQQQQPKMGELAKGMNKERLFPFELQGMATYTVAHSSQSGKHRD